MTKKNSGITLVALTITIIVLLILSAVTISVLNGENGLINHAVNSKTETELAEKKEEVLDEWYKIEFDQAKNYFQFSEMAGDLQERLQQKDPNATVTYQDESETLEISYKNTIIHLDEKGKIVNANE